MNEEHPREQGRFAASRTEQELVQAICRGDEEAVAYFFREFTPQLHAFLIARVTGDTRLAEEVCQAVLMRAMQRISGWRGEASLHTWLCQLAVSELSDKLREAFLRAQLANTPKPDDVFGIEQKED